MLDTDGQQRLSTHHLKSFWTTGGTFNCSILGEFFARLVTNEGSVLIEVFNWVLSTSDHHVKAQLRPMRPSRLETFDLVSDSHPHMAFHADLV